MPTVIDRRNLGAKVARASALGLLALAAALFQAREARAQWSQPDASGHINNTNTGNVGIGTAAPTAQLELRVPTGDVVTRFSNAGGSSGALDLRYKFELQSHRMGLSDGNGQWMFYTQFAPSNTDSVGFFPGRVGIGTSSPGYPLTVRANTNLAPLNLIGGTGSVEIWKDANPLPSKAVSFGSAVPGNAAGDDIQLSTYNGTAWSSRLTVSNATGNVGVGTAIPAAKLHVAGDIRVDGNINAKYQDVAEWVPSVEKLSAGTVVILDIARDNHVAASSTSYDTRVAGVISAQPGLSLGEAGEGKVLVATTGRVKVRVDATQGPISIGDLLVTSDRQGFAMKSEPVQVGKRQMHSPGTIIGKALESLAGGTGEILVLLSLQ